jgi:hypothetical protein
VRDVVVHLGAAGLPAASLAHRCHDVSAELLDPEQLDGEVVEGVVAVVHPIEQGLRPAKCLDRGREDEVGAGQRPDGRAVACVDRLVDPRHELASVGHGAKAI